MPERRQVRPPRAVWRNGLTWCATGRRCRCGARSHAGRAPAAPVSRRLTPALAEGPQFAQQLRRPNAGLDATCRPLFLAATPATGRGAAAAGGYVSGAKGEPPLPTFMLPLSLGSRLGRTEGGRQSVVRFWIQWEAREPSGHSNGGCEPRESVTHAPIGCVKVSLNSPPPPPQQCPAEGQRPIRRPLK